MIDITLLGTAALMPLPERALSAALLTCRGRSVLFDCGEGTQSAARKAGVSLMKTDLIALTHYHGDHTFGLPGLMQTMHCLGRTQPLYLTGPAGLAEAMAPILDLTGETAYEVRLLEIPPEGIRLHHLACGWPQEAVLSAFPTMHRVVSRGYVFSLPRAGRFLPEKAMALGVPQQFWGILQKGQPVCAEGKAVFPAQVLGPPRKGLRVVFSGDTAMCDSLTEVAAGADLLIADATYGENEQASVAEGYGHMNFAQAARTAAAAGVKELWLTHYSQMIADPESYFANASQIFEHTVCGRDGLHKTLCFENV